MSTKTLYILLLLGMIGEIFLHQNVDLLFCRLLDFNLEAPRSNRPSCFQLNPVFLGQLIIWVALILWDETRLN